MGHTVSINLKFWQVDSFAEEAFKGNPAAVFVLREDIPDRLMQQIAIEMNQSETAFVLLRDSQNPLLRWFTPTFEIDLCGHATLAAAHIVFTEIYPDLSRITFDTKFVGPLAVDKQGNGREARYTMDFPSRLGEKIDVATIPACVLEGLGTTARPVEAYKARDLMIVFENDQIITDINPDFNALAKYDAFISVTAPSSDPRYDFVSRFFCADAGISEDPVTGSAHCTLTPYWGMKKNKTRMTAYQASKRGGILELEMAGDRILISGKAVTVIDGTLNV